MCYKLSKLSVSDEILVPLNLLLYVPHTIMFLCIAIKFNSHQICLWSVQKHVIFYSFTYWEENFDVWFSFILKKIATQIIIWWLNFPKNKPTPWLLYFCTCFEVKFQPCNTYLPLYDKILVVLFKVLPLCN